MTLLDKVRFRDIELRNRIVVSPMCMYSSEDGFANAWHIVHLGSLAVGGAGLVFTEATAVVAEGRITNQDLGIYKDEHVQALAEIVEFGHSQGAAMGIQLAHAGRKASTRRPWDPGAAVEDADGGWTPLAPSAIPFSDTYRTPREATLEEIAEVRDHFKKAAERSLRAGFDFVEIHAAHGYLFHEFLSPLSNMRSDAYGGSLENRARLLIESIQDVRKVWPDSKPLFVRISCTDWTERGFSMDEAVVFAGMAQAAGADLIDCSSGGNLAAAIPVGPGYQVEFASRIRKEAKVATGTVGMVTDPHQADTIIRTGQADLVFLARELLRNPHWPIQATVELSGKRPEYTPKQYERAWPG